MSSMKTTRGPAVKPIVKLPPVSPPTPGPQAEWTTVPNRAPVRSRKPPTAPTNHILVLSTKRVPGRRRPSIWSCFQCTDTPPRGRSERQEALKRVFATARAFFAEHDIALSSLNVSSFKGPMTLELFFESKEALWAADNLVEKFSSTLGGGILRHQEDRGTMVVRGVRTMLFKHGMDLDDECLRALEDLNHIFTSNGERFTYRIRNVHYMSSQLTDKELEKSGCTWSVTFNDFRVAKYFIEQGGFNFFGREGRLLPRWYENKLLFGRRNPPHPAGGEKGAAATTAGRQNTVEAKDTNVAGPKAEEAAKATAGNQHKEGSASNTTAGQQNTAEAKDNSVARPKAEEAVKAAVGNQHKGGSASKARNRKRKGNAVARKEAAKSTAGLWMQGAEGAVARPAAASAPRQG